MNILVAFKSNIGMYLNAHSVHMRIENVGARRIQSRRILARYSRCENTFRQRGIGNVHIQEYASALHLYDSHLHAVPPAQESYATIQPS